MEQKTPIKQIVNYGGLYDKMGSVIIISVLLSLLSGIYIRLFPDSSLDSLTYIPIVLMIVLYTYKVSKKREINNYKFFYFLIFLNIFIIIISFWFNSIRFDAIKLITFNLILIVLLNNLNTKIIYRIHYLIFIIGIPLTLNIIITSFSHGFNMQNVYNIRNYTIMDKQFFNVVYNILIPILFWRVIEKKRKLNLLYLILSLFASVFLMQIKTLLITLPLSILIVTLIAFKRKRKIITCIIVLLGCLSGIFRYYLVQIIPAPIYYVIVYLINGINGIPISDYRYTDTILIRQYILSKSIKLFSSNPLFGIGYGNYTEFNLGNILVSQFNRKVEMPTVLENGILYFLVGGGILGLILHAALIIYLFYFLLTKVRKFDYGSITLYTITIAFIISNFVQDNNNYLYWFYIAAGIFTVLKYSKESKTSSNMNSLAD